MARGLTMGFVLAHLAACGLETSATFEGVPTTDAEVGGNAGGRDAASVDASATDAALDGPAMDAGPVIDDGGFDAGALDGGPPFCDPSDGTLRVCIRFEDELRDESAAPHALRERAVAYADGRVGRAAVLGSGVEMWIDQAGDLSTAPLTIELFVRPSSLPSSGRAGVWDLGGYHSAWILPGGDFACRSVTASGVVRTGVWTHVACVFDGTNASVYVDGALVTTGPSGFGVPGGGSIRVGANDPDGDWLDALADELRIFGSTRTAGEIAAAAAR